MKKLFLWQQIIIGLIAVLTAFAIITSESDLNIFSMLFGIVMGVIINVLILYVIFLLSNKIYFKLKKYNEIKIEEEKRFDERFKK